MNGYVFILRPAGPGWTCEGYTVEDTTILSVIAVIEAPAEPPEKWRITAASLRIRSGPGSSWSVVGYYSKGDPVSVYEKSDDGWGRTEKGWIYLAYAELLP